MTYSSKFTPPLSSIHFHLRVFHAFALRRDCGYSVSCKSYMQSSEYAQELCKRHKDCVHGPCLCDRTGWSRSDKCRLRGQSPMLLRLGIQQLAQALGMTTEPEPEQEMRREWEAGNWQIPQKCIQEPAHAKLRVQMLERERPENAAYKKA